MADKPRRTCKAKPGSPLALKRARANLIKAHALAGRQAGLANSRILKKLHAIDPSISLDMVNKAIASLVGEGLVIKRELGSTPGPKPATTARYLRVIDYRLQGESYQDIAFAEGLALPTVKVLLNKNHVHKGSIDNYHPFDPSQLVTSWARKN